MWNICRIVVGLLITASIDRGVDEMFDIMCNSSIDQIFALLHLLFFDIFLHRWYRDQKHAPYSADATGLGEDCARIMDVTFDYGDLGIGGESLCCFRGAIARESEDVEGEWRWIGQEGLYGCTALLARGACDKDVSSS